MRCEDHERHERLLECRHAGTGRAELHVAFADGCSGRICPACGDRLGVSCWRDLTEALSGPEPGLDLLDLLQLLRAAR